MIVDRFVKQMTAEARLAKRRNERRLLAAKLKMKGR